MVNPDLLIDALRDKLRALPAIVSLVEIAENINVYEDNERGLVEAIFTMPTPSILVAWLGNEPGEEGFGSWIQVTGIYLKIGDTRLGFAFNSICSAVDGDGLKFTEAEIHSDFEQLGVPILTRDTDQDGIERPRIEMRFRQRSLD